MKRIKLVVFFILGLFMLTSCSSLNHESFPSGPQIEEPGTNPDDPTSGVSSYLITYYENGLKVHQEKLESGKALPQVESTKAPLGQTFLGWSTSKDEYVPVDFDVMPDKEVKLYAFYQKVKYTITFIANITLPDGTTTSKEYEYQDRLGEFVPSDLQELIDAQTEYVFVGWFLDPEFENEFIEVSMPAENITLYAKWQFSGIRFMNGSEVFYEVKDDEGALVQKPLQVPTKPGYDFGGWVDAYGNEVSFPLTVTDEVQFVYASFVAKNNITYKVEHYLENLNGTFVRQEVVELVGTTDELVEALWKSYTGFTKDEDNENNVLKGNVNYNGSLVLKLYYSRNSYKVTFETNGGSQVEEVSYKYEQMVTAPSSPNKLGYTFAGWELNGEAYSFTNMPANDIELSAKWQLVEYTVTFVANEVVGKVTYTVENKEITEPAVPAIEHFTGAWEEYELTTGNITVKAVYTPVTYTVIFKAEGVVVDTENYTVVNPTITEPSVPTKAHYTGAWESYVLAGGNVEVEAIYTPVTYYVTFVAEGTEVAKLPYTVENTTVVNPTVPTKAHYTGAWESYTLTSGNIEVEAVYTPVTYYVTFVAEGTEVAKLPYTVENTTVVNPTVPAKAHYTGAWESYTLTSGNVEVEAVYTPVTYYVTFVAEGTEVAKLPYTVENTTVVNPTVPAKAHYTGAWESYTLTSGNVEVEAVYTPVTYYVTFVAEGTEVAKLPYTVENTTIAEPTVPAKAHYTGAWESYVLVGGNVEVEAIYTPVTYYVTFVAEGAEVAKLPYTVENITVVNPTVPAKLGYTGVWEAYTLTSGNIEVNAVYTVNQYTITFNVNGGTTVSSITQDYGTTIVVPANPTKGGHNFAGWDIEIPSTMPAENITINALWEVKKLEVGAGKDYATITEALQYANGNEIITVFPGSYDENLVIDKPITLKGSNAGVNPNTSVRTSETYIKSITIKASNVTIDGFAFADSLASTSLITINNAKLSNITLSNIVIEKQTKFNTNSTGLIKAVATDSNSISNLVIDGFLVEKASLRPTFLFASQIDGFTLINSGLYGSNALSSYTDCVKFDTAANYGVKGNVLIDNNIFKDYGQYILWFREIGTGTYEISNNQFINCGQTAGSHGAVTFASYAADATSIEIDFHHNILDDSYMMFRVDSWSSATASNLIMKCNYNTVSNCLGTYHVKNSNTSSIVDATNNKFDTTPTDSLFLNANWKYPFEIIFELNGGHLYYETREELVDAFLTDAMAWAGKTGSKPTCMVNDGGGSGLGFANVFSAIYGIFSDATYGSKWSWLKDYIISVTTNTTTKSNLQSGQEAYWRYSLGAFLFEDYRSTWPASEDFTNSEKANGFWNSLSKVIVDSSSYVLPTEAYKEGFVFAGWYNNPEFTGAAVTSVSQYSVLYAKFDIVYNVEYNYNGGHAYYETIQDIAHDFLIDFQSATGKEITSDALYSVGNYYDEFFNAEGMYDKWIWMIELFAELGKEGIGYHSESQAQYEAFINGNITSSSGQWAIRQNIRGLMNEIKSGNYSKYAAIDFADPEIISRVWQKLSEKASDLAVFENSNTPTSVYKEGYVFEGWYDNPEFTGSLVTTVTKDMKLYAKYTEKFNVELNLNDGTYTEYQNITELSQAFKNAMTDAFGEAFTNWSGSSRKILNLFVNSDEWDWILNAWAAVNTNAYSGVNNADVIMNVYNNKAQSIDPYYISTEAYAFAQLSVSKVYSSALVSANYGDAAVQQVIWEYYLENLINKQNLTSEYTLPTPTKEYYDFAGWYTNPEFTGEALTKVSSDSILYAKWTPKEYTITFDTNGGSSVNPITQGHGTSVVAPQEPTKRGYLFKGWSPELPLVMGKENITVTAIWEELKSTSISFASKDNRTSFSTTMQVWEQSGITVTNNKAKSTNNVADYANPVRFYKSSDLVIEYPYPIYEIEIECAGGSDYYIPSTYKVNGATLTVSGSKATIVLDTPTTSVTLSTLPNQIRVSKITIKTAETLKTYSVDFDSNSGTGTIDSINNIEGAIVKLPSSTGITAPSNMKFSHWNTKSDGTGTTYNSGDEITLNSNLVLYAIWTENQAVEMTIEEAKQQEDGVNVIISGVVVSIDYAWNDTYKNMSVTIKDATGSIYAYKLNSKVELGDLVKITGQMGSYSGSKQIAEGAIATITGALQVNISYNSNGGTGTIATMTVKAGQNIDLADGNQFTAPAGKVFIGWSTDPDASTPTYGSGDVIASFEDISLYAVWADETSGDEPILIDKSYSYTFSAKQYTANGTKSLGGINWTISGSGGYWGYDATKGQQFGSASKPYKSLTVLSGTEFTHVSQIIINTSGASSINGTLIVYVGDVQVGSSIKLTSSATSYTINLPTDLTGQVKLVYSQTSSKAIYIKSITVNYAVEE